MPAPRSSLRLWFPFTSNEIQIGLGVLGFAVTTFAFAGVPPLALAKATLAAVVVAYVSGLLVYARRAAPTTALIRDGAIAGAGYIDSFRHATRSLFLIHVDDDPPGEDLRRLYRSLLDRGVQIRRVILLRRDAHPEAYAWIHRFGTHRNLQQRVILPSQSAAVRFSFVVVDEDEVLLALPGAHAVDARPYASALVLRHLLRIRDPEVAELFLHLHEDLWARATPLSPKSITRAGRARPARRS
jgi:hypothetical protein